jgi:hypothetical protein
LDLADAALYRAKARGGRCCEIVGDSEAEDAAMARGNGEPATA